MIFEKLWSFLNFTSPAPQEPLLSPLQLVLNVVIVSTSPPGVVHAPHSKKDGLCSKKQSATMPVGLHLKGAEAGETPSTVSNCKIAEVKFDG